MEESNMQDTSHVDDNKYEEEPQPTEKGGRELFWRVLQNEMHQEIPVYVKNVLRLCHLDKPQNVRMIRDETIAEIEKFARKSMLYQLMGVELNLEDYYGPFYKMPSKFQFVIGDRFLIKQLVLCVKNKSDDFWRRALTPQLITATTPTTTTTTVRYVQLRDSGVVNETTSTAQHANSELELSDEEDKQEETLDLDRERRKLIEMVRSMLLREDFGNEVDSKQLAGRVKVRVAVKPMDDREGEVVTGFIKCVFCPTRLMIRKQTFGGRKPRWVISNYRRHIRFHTDGKLKRPSSTNLSAGSSQQSLYNTEFLLVNPDDPLGEQVDEQSNEAEQHDIEENE